MLSPDETGWKIGGGISSLRRHLGPKTQSHQRGTVVLEGEPVVEGEKVTVLSRISGETFRVSPEEKHLLLESITQADRGELVDADELLAELDESN